MPINNRIVVSLPREFSFTEVLRFLSRSDREILYSISNRKIRKLLRIEKELILVEISSDDQNLNIEILNTQPNPESISKISDYVTDWFDLKRDLKPFYEFSSTDKILNTLSRKYFGLRHIGIGNLFEALCWAIIGQQINLQYCYTLNNNFVMKFGDSIQYEGKVYWAHPVPESIIKEKPDTFRAMSMTSRKGEYLIEVARRICDGSLNKSKLLISPDVAGQLMKIHGIGRWTAEYVMLKCLKIPTAFPVGDAGLQNAIRNQLGLDRKPIAEEINELVSRWDGWAFYAGIYLWRSLYDDRVGHIK